MPITTENPIVIPAVEQKIADKLWITQLVSLAPTVNQSTRVIIKVMPYNSSTNESFPSLEKTIVIEDLNAAASQTPEIGQAMQGVYNGVDAYIKNNNLV